MSTIGSKSPTGTAATMAVKFSNSELKTMNNTTTKIYEGLKLAVNALLYAVYHKTHEN